MIFKVVIFQHQAYCDLRYFLDQKFSWRNKERYVFKFTLPTFDDANDISESAVFEGDEANIRIGMGCLFFGDAVDASVVLPKNLDGDDCNVVDGGLSSWGFTGSGMGILFGGRRGGAGGGMFVMDIGWAFECTSPSNFGGSLSFAFFR